MLRVMADPDLAEPVLPGRGASDYARYLRTDELLALQKTPQEQAHRDELLFQTVHQSSELWLKLACWEVEAATARIGTRELAAAARLLRRAALCLDFVTHELAMLEQLSPWEYQSVRAELGHGSGFDSPGFCEVRRVSPPLGAAFQALLAESGLDAESLYVEGGEELFQLAEGLVDWDERIALWRVRHYEVVARIIGDNVIGTQGTPVEVLGRLLHHRYYPALWEVRNRLTVRAGGTSA
jgi:tryptophan 2,3-dioxygenase